MKFKTFFAKQRKPKREQKYNFWTRRLYMQMMLPIRDLFPNIQTVHTA